MPANKTSPVWNYFYQDTSKTVRCTLCDTTLKYFGSTSNMSAHFKAKHGVPLGDESTEGEKDKSQMEDEYKMDDTSRSSTPDSPVETRRKSPKEFKKRSNVWKFFTQEGPRGVRCNICNKLLKYCGSTTNMNSHLKCKHANDSSSEFTAPVKKERTEFTDEDDDDDDFVAKTNSTPVTEPRVSRSMTLKKKTGQDSGGSDKKISKAEVKEILLDSRKFLKAANEKMRPETELEIFGKYIAAQLAKLSAEEQLHAQKTIQSLLTQYRLKALKKEVSALEAAAQMPMVEAVQSTSISSEQLRHNEQNDHESLMSY